MYGALIQGGLQSGSDLRGQCERRGEWRGRHSDGSLLDHPI